MQLTADKFVLLRKVQAFSFWFVHDLYRISWQSHVPVTVRLLLE
jgi:hypothetical protein